MPRGTLCGASPTDSGISYRDAKDLPFRYVSIVEAECMMHASIKRTEMS